MSAYRPSIDVPIEVIGFVRKLRPSPSRMVVLSLDDYRMTISTRFCSQVFRCTSIDSTFVMDSLLCTML